MRTACSIGAMALLAACATPPVPQVDVSADKLPDIAYLKVQDLRAEYRQAFCQRLPANARCDDVLLHFPGERGQVWSSEVATSPVQQKEAIAALTKRFRIALAPGFLTGCTGSVSMPLTDTLDALLAQGFDAKLLKIEGRGSTEQNGDLIAQQLSEAPNDPRTWIVLGYSKGLPDTLDALVRHPVLSRNVAAILSYAGALGGSLVADDLGSWKEKLVEALPMPGCAAGDGASIRELHRDVRRAWWDANRSRVHVPIFSLVGTPRPERVSPGLRKYYEQIAPVSAFNDGQLLATDAIVPGSRFLGYVNADHWGIAIPMSSQAPLLSKMYIDDVPRGDLVIAALLVIGNHTPSRND